MANFDDFEMIDETVLSDEPVFELIDMNGGIEKHGKLSTPTTPDLVLPLLIPKPLAEETSQVIEQQTSNSIVNTPESEQPPSPIQTNSSVAPFISIKPTVVQPLPTPIVFAPVPPLPKAPPLRRYGDAAVIPHNLNTSVDINAAIDKSRQSQQNTLQFSIQQQKEHDIQIVLEQRRQLFNKNKF
jgi:hypothetical protein